MDYIDVESTESKGERRAWVKQSDYTIKRVEDVHDLWLGLMTAVERDYKKRKLEVEFVKKICKAKQIAVTFRVLGDKK